MQTEMRTGAASPADAGRGLGCCHTLYTFIHSFEQAATQQYRTATAQQYRTATAQQYRRATTQKYRTATTQQYRTARSGEALSGLLPAFYTSRSTSQHPVVQQQGQRLPLSSITVLNGCEVIPVSPMQTCCVCQCSMKSTLSLPLDREKEPMAALTMMHWYRKLCRGDAHQCVPCTCLPTSVLYA